MNEHHYSLPEYRFGLETSIPHCLWIVVTHSKWRIVHQWWLATNHRMAAVVLDDILPGATSRKLIIYNNRRNELCYQCKFNFSNSALQRLWCEWSMAPVCLQDHHGSSPRPKNQSILLDLFGIKLVLAWLAFQNSNTCFPSNSWMREQLSALEAGGCYWKMY